MRRYRDRRHAGRILAEAVAARSFAHPVVLALPRGGVVVAAEVATVLDAPLDVLVVRKLGVPWHPELGMGAIAERRVMLLNEEVVRATGVTPAEIEEVRRREEAELARRSTVYRQGRSPLDLTDTTAVIVDDGLATGFTARAAIESARRGGAARVVLAVPVGAADTVAALGRIADEVICPLAPRDFLAVGAWYDDFAQVSDEEVVAILRRVAEAGVAGSGDVGDS